MNPYRTNDLWCKKCLWHRCRCVQVGFDPAVLGGDRTVVWPPQYRQTMTMDGLLRNTWAATIEDLKERDE